MFHKANDVISIKLMFKRHMPECDVFKVRHIHGPN